MLGNTRGPDRQPDRRVHAVILQQVRTFGLDSEVPVFVSAWSARHQPVEQILASHPQVHGAANGRRSTSWPRNLRDEGRGMRDERTKRLRPSIHPSSLLPLRFIPHPSSFIPFELSACVQHLNPGAVRSLAYGYLQRLARQAGTASRIVEQDAAQLSAPGPDRLLFPRARIIHCRRDPLDVCASAYFQNFKWMPHGRASLEDIAFHHGKYERLMAHWRRVLPVPIHEVVYESWLPTRPRSPRLGGRLRTGLG